MHNARWTLVQYAKTRKMVDGSASIFERDTRLHRDAVSPFRDIARGISGRYWTLVHCRVLPARATVPSAILDCAAAFDRMSVVDSARGMSAYHKVTVDSDASVPAAALLGALVDAMECHASQR